MFRQDRKLEKLALSLSVLIAGFGLFRAAEAFQARQGPSGLLAGLVWLLIGGFLAESFFHQYQAPSRTGAGYYWVLLFVVGLLVWGFARGVW